MTQSERTLTIVHGAGAGWQVDSETAAQYSGTTEDALRAILREHATETEGVLAELDDPDRILEIYRRTEDGIQENHLSGETDWSEIVQQLEEESLYIGIARRYVGGRD